MLSQLERGTCVSIRLDPIPRLDLSAEEFHLYFCGGHQAFLLSFLRGGRCDGSGDPFERHLLTATLFSYLLHLSRQGFVPGAELLRLAFRPFLALRLLLCFRR